MNIRIHPEIANKILIGYLVIEKLKNQLENAALWEEIEELGQHYRSQFNNPSEALELLKPARQLYHTFGMEPTRYRPSSEALLRRVVKNKGLYRINSIVDTANYCSLSFLLPIGLYDLTKIQGNVELRLGKEGEQYDGIRKDVIHVTGKLTLVDDLGPFGNPSSDSLRTSVDLDTQHILMVLFAPGEYSKEKMLDHLNFSTEKMLQFHPTGRLIEKRILPE